VFLAGTNNSSPSVEIGVSLLSILMKYYKHFKGGFYKELHRKGRECTAETKVLVTYKALQDSTDFKKGQIWHRQVKEFDGFNSYGIKRYRKLTLLECILLMLKYRHKIR